MPTVIPSAIGADPAPDLMMSIKPFDVTRQRRFGMSGEANKRLGQE